MKAFEIAILRTDNFTAANSGLPKAGGDVVAESLVHLINFTTSRQFTAPKTPPSASRKTLAAIFGRQTIKTKQ